MRKNEKGSSLIFALAVISIITMVIAACMAISYSYYNRSIVANSERQAYLTAKSVLTNIVDNITAKDVNYLNLIPEIKENDINKVYYKVSDNFPSNEMGTIDDIQLNRFLEEKDENGKIKDNLTISVTASYGNISKTLNADIKQYQGESDNWQLSKYYEGQKEIEIDMNINVKNAISENVFPDVLTEAYQENPKWNSPNLLAKLKENEAAWKIMEDRGWTYQSRNDNLRDYIYYGINQGKWVSFDTNAVVSGLPSTVVLPNNLTIQPYFTKDLTVCVMYASTSTIVSGGGWSGVRVIYNPYTKAWYYLYRDMSVSEFSNFASPNEKYLLEEDKDKEIVFDSGKEYFKYFLENYITNKNNAIVIS